MAVVKVEEGESIDRAINRFRRECECEGILREWKRRTYYEKPAEQRKNRKKEVERKQLKKLRKMQSRSYR